MTPKTPSAANVRAVRPNATISAMLNSIDAEEARDKSGMERTLATATPPVACCRSRWSDPARTSSSARERDHPRQPDAVSRQHRELIRGNLRQRHVGGRARLPFETHVADVADHADDLPRRRLFELGADSLTNEHVVSERAFGRPELPRHALVDDDDGSGRRDL